MKTVAEIEKALDALGVSRATLTWDAVRLEPPRSSRQITVYRDTAVFDLERYDGKGFVDSIDLRDADEQVNEQVKERFDWLNSANVQNSEG